MATETIKTIEPTPAQARAIRKMALANNGISNNEMASLLFRRAVKNTFVPMTKGVGEKAAKLFDLATAGGFAPDVTREEYIKRAQAEYREILADLEA